VKVRRHFGDTHEEAEEEFSQNILKFEGNTCIFRLIIIAVRNIPFDVAERNQSKKSIQ
jgi:hypothetical protein